MAARPGWNTTGTGVREGVDVVGGTAGGEILSRTVLQQRVGSIVTKQKTEAEMVNIVWGQL